MKIFTRIAYLFSLILVICICLAGVPLFFYYDNDLSNLLCRVLKLKIDPSFTGGEVAQKCFDEAGDDKGSNILSYPLNSSFTEGCLDLTGLTVHQCVMDSRWQKYKNYIQMDLSFAGTNPETRVVMIYIDAPSVEGGSTQTLYEEAESVTFSQDNPWDFAFRIADKKVEAFDSHKDFITEGQLDEKENGKKVCFRIPLDDKRLQSLYHEDFLNLYVLVCSFSPFERGEIGTIGKRKSLASGSVSKASLYSPLIPRVYDILTDGQEEDSQAKQLASFNEDELTRAVLKSVKIDMKKEAKADDYGKVMDEIQKDYYEYAVALNAESYLSPGQNRAVRAFNEGKNDEAERLFAGLLKENPDDELSLAYYGSLIAMKGGQGNIMQAVKLCNEAIEMLDRAREQSRGKPTEYDVLQNRGNVYLSIPDSVFGKAETGGRDFIDAASLYKAQIEEGKYSENDCKVLSYLYLKASFCYKACGKEDEGEMYFREALKYHGAASENNQE